MAGDGGSLWAQRTLLGLNDSVDYGPIQHRDATAGDERVLQEVSGCRCWREVARDCTRDGAEEHQVVEFELGATLRLAQLKLIVINGIKDEGEGMWVNIYYFYYKKRFSL